ncbi:hypothetical protein HOU70_gp64 [Arthrobacter phage Liebe]|uniref:DUF7246 domain-containing protein n=2 Tax=Arthrobacter virus Liebe TaxID=2734245 RepID=A0A3G2KHU2_9CAUD|nr:hypothetical protein HOU70_gp64 [Arthrobacter phage Liebe]AYN58545.1 hypothetical protein PBI_MAUREEN_64 [Arthrobacter phage Maureen]AZF93797.1 hypothetical protein PBI_LIEBE_64 [Arthrobacter phage Liebe]
MARRRSNVRLPSSWSVFDAAAVNGRQLVPGTEVSIRGERGRFRFLKRVVLDDGREWLDFWGGPKGAPQWRSFAPEQVRRVHRVNKTETALAEEHKRKVAARRAG